MDGAFAGLLLAGAIREFERGLPDSGAIDLSWAGHGSNAETLLGAGADLALVGVAPSAPGISSAVLTRTERVVLVGASHRLAASRTVAFDELAGEPELQAQSAGRRWKQTWSVAGIAGHAISAGQRFHRFEDALDLVAAGRGILLAPGTAELRHARPDVCWPALEGVGPAEVHLAWRTGCRAPAVGEFIDTLGRLATRQGAEDREAGEPITGGPARAPGNYGIIVP